MPRELFRLTSITPSVVTCASAKGARYEVLAMGTTQNQEAHPMHTYAFITRAVFPSSLFLVASLSALATLASDSDRSQAAQEGMGVAPASALSVMASGAVEDTLVACLERIPADATAGQRLLAEQSCERAEDTKKWIHAAPRF